MQDGEMLMSDSRIHVDSMSGVVYFTPVHKDDEGTYNCTAFNDVGTVSSSNQLRVFGNTLHIYVILKCSKVPDLVTESCNLC